MPLDRWDRRLPGARPLTSERDLGPERGAVLVEKLRRYRNVYWRGKERQVLHVGIVVESQRRAMLCDGSCAHPPSRWPRAIRVWVTTEAELTADPHGAVWISPSVEAIRTIDLGPHRSTTPGQSSSRCAWRH
jgi:hypothetical protein